MFYPYRTVLEETVTAPPLGEMDPIELSLELFYAVSKLFSTQPSVLYAPGASALTLILRDAVFLWRDVTGPFGNAIAALSARWPLTLYGTTEHRETAELTLRREGERQITRLRCVSGRHFDSLHGLGIRLETDRAEQAACLAEAAAQISHLRTCAAVSRRHQGVLGNCALLSGTVGSLYCYLDWEQTPPGLLLDSLSPSQKAHLWRTFLLNRTQPLEFDWLWGAYYTDQSIALLEWELVLRSVLEDLHFQVERDEASFCVTDGQGNARRFDFDRGGPAEKLFLKLLFPVDAKT